MDIKKYLATTSQNEVVKHLEELSKSEDESSYESLKEFLRVRDDHTYYKRETPRIACLALLQKGAKGIDSLIEVLPEAPGSIYPTAIIETLFLASKNELSGGLYFSNDKPTDYLTKSLNGDLLNKVNEALRYVVLEGAHNSELFGPLIQFVYQQNFISDIKAGKEGSFKEDFFNLMLEGRILITASLIRNFSELIEKEEREEEYQIFLSNNPVFLDPIASEVIPKQKLGVEYITDFVIKKLDNKYILVEIEKPQDKIFTNADEFSSKFTHALGQVLDFQEWIDSNGAYAKTLLPDISSPRGLLIMGRSKTMSQRQKDKLKRFNANSANIDVLTFDEVHDMAGKLLQNVIKSH